MPMIKSQKGEVMKKKLVVACVILMLAVLPTARTEAAIPIIQIIKEAVIKVIKAVDLMIQRLQTKTIWLPYGALPEGTGSAAY